jgi:uncharacterized protein with HEPN domain
MHQGAERTLIRKSPEIPSREIVGMRNSVIHGYFEVNWTRVWEVTEGDLPPLKVAIQRLIASLG